MSFFTQRKHIRSLVVLKAATVAIAVLMLIASAIYTGSLLHRSNYSSTTTNQERLTELYFTDHTHLPTTYVPGQAATIAFTVHNLEFEQKTYTYQIVQTDEKGNIVQSLPQETITLSNNEYRGIASQITYIDAGGRSNIEIRLLTKSQSIAYWVEKATI